MERARRANLRSMARPARVLVPGLPNAVTPRGNGEARTRTQAEEARVGGRGNGFARCRHNSRLTFARPGRRATG